MKSFGRLRILKQTDDSGTESYLVLDPERGREILLHILPAERNEANRILWERLDKGLAEHQNLILDSGDLLGVRYVLTEYQPQFSSLVALLESAARSSQAAGPVEEPGSFTRLFTPVKPEPEAVGSFTRAFGGAPANASASLEETASMPMRAPIAAASPPASKEVGAFTRMFQPQAATKQAENPTPPVRSGDSEFTRMFRAPETNPVATFAQTSAPAQEPPSATPLGDNDKTRLFAKQAVAPPSPEKQADNFSKFFQSPLEAKKADIDFDKLPVQEAPAARPAGEFTRMFGKPFATAPQKSSPQKASAPAREGHAEATGVFARPNSAASNSQANQSASTGPSEYTRMFGAQRLASRAEAAQPPVEAPQKQPAAAPPVMLFVILGVLAFLAIALVLYFALKH